MTARSGACPPECLAAACTLGQIAAARRAAIRDPRITLWAELAVLAHLTGWILPQPRPDFTAALNGMDRRERDCALAHAAEVAAASRAAALVPRVAPLPLAGHTAAAMRTALDGGPPCPPEEPQWLAPACEWDPIADELRAAAANGTPGRHPRSAEWEHARGRAIPGGDCAAQLAAVTRWQDNAWKQSRARAVTVYGTGTPSAVEHAIRSRKTAPGWRGHAATALAETLAGADWALDYLAPAPTGEDASSSGPGDQP